MKDIRTDPLISQWLSDGPSDAPAAGLERALMATRKVAQRPGWTFPRRWLPQPFADTELRLPLPAGVALVVLLALLLAIALGAAIVATRPPPLRLQVGPSAAALMAYQEGPSLFASRLDGSSLRELSIGVDYARSPVFSPDGARVAFVAPESAAALGGRLMVVPADGSATAIDISHGIDVLPSEVPAIAWSPDGQRITFAGEQGGVATIFVAAADGGDVSAITDGTADRDLPSWSPDGEWIAYRAREPDGIRAHLQLVRPDGSDMQQVTTVIAEGGSLSRLRWSPSAMAGSSQGQHALSYAMNVGFGTQTVALIDLGFQHTVSPWTEGVGGYVDAGIPWSPDGQQLAILTASDGLVVADYDQTGPDYEGELRSLGHVIDCWVEWSPDGTALYGGSPDGCSSVVVVPLADPDAVATLPMSGVADWQPLER